MEKKDYRQKDRSGNVLGVTLGICAALVLLGAVPSFHINDLEVRRANLLSPFIHSDDDGNVCTSSSEWIEDGKLYQNYTASTVSYLPDCSGTDSLADICSGGAGFVPAGSIPSSLHEGIEDYGDSRMMMERFLRNLESESGSRNIRIAFLGDSFIEGDILTSSFRSDLQNTYGGEGVGFVPFADPIARYRATVNQVYDGWTCYNLLRKQSVPERYQQDFFMSGYISVPVAGATAVFRSGTYKGRKLTSSHAKILFKNRADGKMDVVVNSVDTLRYELAESDDVQCIDINHNDIECLSVSLPVCRDFVGYGVVFEGETGVTVDNYGLRSHSGINLLSTSYNVNSRIGELRNYDLVVLEYGLNAMQKTQTQYGYYTDKLEKVVAYVRKSFPNSAIMMLSVGDVGMKVDGRIVTAPAVPAMVNGLRSVAEHCDISFWNMYQGMGGSGSMKHFVENGWAGKDYLHINSRGGDHLAKKLLDSLLGRRDEDTHKTSNI